MSDEEIPTPARREANLDDDDDANTPTKIAATKTNTFAINPAQAITGYLNYSLKQHQTVYASGITSIYPGDEKFDLESATMRVFIQGCAARGEKYGWDTRDITANHDPSRQGIFQVNTTKGYINIIRNYAKLSLDEIKNYEETYLTTKSRKAQDNYMFYEAMFNSLTAKATVRIRNHDAEYRVDGKPSALLLFKVIVRESHVDSGATAHQIRRQMQAISQLMAKLQWQIITFNEAVRELMSRLEARGETSTDLLMYLFDAYLTCKDETFIDYIKVKQREYYDNKLPEYTPNDLMHHAEEEYKRLIMENKWEAPSQQEEKIIALLSEINDKRSNGKGNSHGKGKGNGNPKRKGYEKGKRYPKGLSEEELRKPPPRDKMHLPRVFNGKEFWWCHPDTGGKCDGWWRVHKPTGGENPCRGASKNANKHSSTTPEPKEMKKPSKMAKLQASLQALIEDQE
jgi:hypothetical protein